MPEKERPRQMEDVGGVRESWLNRFADSDHAAGWLKKGFRRLGLPLPPSPSEHHCARL
jgi:hypothetical protein